MIVATTNWGQDLTQTEYPYDGTNFIWIANLIRQVASFQHMCKKFFLPSETEYQSNLSYAMYYSVLQSSCQPHG